MNQRNTKIQCIDFHFHPVRWRRSTFGNSSCLANWNSWALHIITNIRRSWRAHGRRRTARNNGSQGMAEWRVFSSLDFCFAFGSRAEQMDNWETPRGNPTGRSFPQPKNWERDHRARKKTCRSSHFIPAKHRRKNHGPTSPRSCKGITASQGFHPQETIMKSPMPGWGPRDQAGSQSLHCHLAMCSLPWCWWSHVENLGFHGYPAVTRLPSASLLQWHQISGTFTS